MFKRNDRYLIRTPTGYEAFEGIKTKSVSVMFTFRFNDGTHIKCSDKHAFLTNRGMITSENITKEDNITGKSIESIEVETGTFEVFDPVGVDKHNTYYSNDVISHNTEFLGSSDTLISSAKMQQLIAGMQNPLTVIDNDLVIYEHPQENHTYVLSVDVSEGQGNDYSAFSIIDVTTIPYRQVARYRNNKITPMVFPTVIYSEAMRYNEAFVLIEINSIGLEVADILHYDLAYENLVKIAVQGKKGQQATPGYTKRMAMGIKQSVQTKKIGCANIKSIIETDKLLVFDIDTINEMTTFTANGKSYAADEGSTDDLMMTLVNFGWLTSQRYFRESVGNDIRQVLQKELLDIQDRDLLPDFGYDNGLDDPFDREFDGKDTWIADREKIFTFDNLDWDMLINKHRL